MNERRIPRQLQTCEHCGRMDESVCGPSASVGFCKFFALPKETVSHPQHYGGDTVYETIKVLEAWLTPEQFDGFLIGNSIKYQSRFRHKGGIEDLKKSRWYLDYYLQKRGEAK